MLSRVMITVFILCVSSNGVAMYDEFDAVVAELDEQNSNSDLVDISPEELFANKQVFCGSLKDLHAQWQEEIKNHVLSKEEKREFDKICKADEDLRLEKWKQFNEIGFKIYWYNGNLAELSLLVCAGVLKAHEVKEKSLRKISTFSEEEMERLTKFEQEKGCSPDKSLT